MGYTLILKVLELGVMWGINVLASKPQLGISSRIAKGMLDAINKSDSNPITCDLLVDANSVLKDV